MSELSLPFTSLEGSFVRLELLSEATVSELREPLFHREVFEGGYGGGLSALPTSEEAFDKFLLSYLPWQSGKTFIVRIANGPRAGTAVGTTSLGEINISQRNIHLGWTAYDPRVWGTAVNAESKLLLLSAVFDAGFERAQLQADRMNTRSLSAIELLGAVYEGTHRHDRIRPDGSWRDTVVFSILAAEWPAVKAGLLRRLEHWQDRPVLFRTP